MHSVNHNVDDFRLPFNEDTLRSGIHHSETLTQKQMAALEACLNAAQRTIGNYCTFGHKALSGLPTVLFFVRVFYALIVLIKMHMAVTTPGSEVGKIIKPEDIKAEEHLDSLWSLVMAMSKHDSYRPHSKIPKILGMLRDWFTSYRDREIEQRKPSPYGRFPHNESKLQVLSEAATAGSGRPPSEVASKSGAPSPRWTFDSPSAGWATTKDAGSAPSTEKYGSSTNTPRPSSHPRDRPLRSAAGLRPRPRRRSQPRSRGCFGETRSRGSTTGTRPPGGSHRGGRRNRHVVAVFVFGVACGRRTRVMVLHLGQGWLPTKH